MRTSFLAVAVFVAVASGTAEAQTVATFDSDPSIGFRAASGGVCCDPANPFRGWIPDGYAGLNWTGFDVGAPDHWSPHPIQYTWNQDLSIQTTTASADVGVAWGQEGAGIHSSSAPFDFLQAHVAANWLNGVGLNVWGFRNGVATYFRSFIINVDSFALLTFDFYKVDRVTFATVGGCGSSGLTQYLDGWNYPTAHRPDPTACRPPGDDTWGGMTVDNVTVPEPSELLLAGTGLLGLLSLAGLRGRWKRSGRQPNA